MDNVSLLDMDNVSLLNMDNVSLFAYAIVVVLMAMYVWNNERRMREMFFKLNQTAQLQQQTLDSLYKKMADIGKKNEIKLQDTENRNNLTTSRLQKQLNDMTELAQLQQQKLDSFNEKVADNEKKNEMKLQVSENRNSLTISHLQKQIKDITEKRPSIVTFLARLIAPEYGSITAHATVKFEKITENIGSGYNSGTGIFTAPTKGLYHFTASARQSISGYLHLGLFRNDKDMAVSVAMNFNSLTISATFTLQSGDRVYVKNIWKESSGIIGIGQSYFSGYLVHKM